MRHLKHVDEHVDLAPVVGVIEVQTPVSLHEVEPLIGLVTKRRKQVEHPLPVAFRDRVVEIAVLSLERSLARACRVKVYAGAAQQLESHMVFLGCFRDASGLRDGILERSAHAPSISMTIVLRSVICSSAKRPPTRPMPLFLPARPPNGRCASQ